VGYTGGENPSPTYQSVCAGDGHTEALQIEYDPSVIDYEALLGKFWTIHRYSENLETQYKSAIWAHSDEQRAIAENTKKTMQSEGRQVATEVHDQAPWHDAEEYHQNFMAKMRAGQYFSPEI
jgi:peptide-methionine (S)-S-oxide reductase